MGAPDNQQTKVEPIYVNTQQDTEKTNGSPLLSHDILLLNAAERKIYIEILREEYGINFQNSIDPIPDTRSQTSLKCLLYNEEGLPYFLKQKSAYCIESLQLEHSAKLQDLVADKLDLAPRIIRSSNGSHYLKIGNRVFLLTPYVEGNFFMGRQQQSVSSIRSLSSIHQLTINEDLFLDSVNSHNESVNWVSFAGSIETNLESVKNRVISRLQELINNNKRLNQDPRAMLHGDFAPFNIVFRKDSVVSVNDFDNVKTGPVSRDVAECILTNTGIMYAGVTSSMRTPILTNIDVNRAKSMKENYENGFKNDIINNLRQELMLIWIELISLGIVRGDFKFSDVDLALDRINDLEKQFDYICK